MSDELFKIPEQLSPMLQRQRDLIAIAESHGVKTNFSDGVPAEEGWMAVLPFEGDEKKPVVQMMMESCRLYDEAGNTATGPTREIAILNLVEQLNLTAKP